MLMLLLTQVSAFQTSRTLMCGGRAGDGGPSSESPSSRRCCFCGSPAIPSSPLQGDTHRRTCLTFASCSGSNLWTNRRAFVVPCEDICVFCELSEVSTRSGGHCWSQWPSSPRIEKAFGCLDRSQNQKINQRATHFCGSAGCKQGRVWLTASQQNRWISQSWSFTESAEIIVHPAVSPFIYDNADNCERQTRAADSTCLSDCSPAESSCIRTNLSHSLCKCEKK